MPKRLYRLRKSVLFSWLVSYLSILFIPIIISGIVYVQSVRVVQGQVVSINDAMIRQLQQVIDGQVQNIQKIAQQIAVNPKLESFTGKQGEPAPEMNFAYSERIKQLFQDLSIYTLSNSYIRDFYIYLHQSGMVLTSNGYYDSRTFFDFYINTGEQTYEEWHRTMLEKHYGRFIVMAARQIGGTSNLMTYLLSLPPQTENPNTTLAVFIDRMRLQSLVESVNWANQELFFIVDERNQVLFSTKDMALPAFVRYEDMAGEGGVVYGRLGDTEVAASYTSSHAADWKYISIARTSIFNEKVAFIRRLTLIGLVLCMAIGGVIAYWFTKKNYNPLSELLETIALKAGIKRETAQEANEYRFLSEVLTLAISEKQQSDRKLEQQAAALRSSFLTRLLKGRLGQAVSLEEALRGHGIRFGAPVFAVIVFYIEDYSGVLTGYKDQADAEERLRLAQFVLSNVAEEALSRRHSAYIAEVDDLLACIVNAEEAEPEALYAELEDGVREVQELLRRKFHIYFTAAISETRRTPSAISEAYQMALEALEYKLIKGKGGVIRYTDIKQPETGAGLGHYSYSLETEQILTNRIKAGDFAQAEAIIDQVFADNFARGLPSVELAKCLMFDLVGTMIKTMHEISAIYEPGFIDELDPVNRLLRCNTAEEMRGEMSALLRKVCVYIEDRSKGQSQQRLRDRLVAFIEAHYGDSNLNLPMIAEHVDLSPKYVSSFFKQATGEGISGYIQKYRLKQAKALLKQEKLSIADIAGMVGFTNSNAMIRAFNKYEGVTPGQFREMGPPTGE